MSTVDQAAEPSHSAHTTAALGKERYENSRAKCLLYGDDPNRPLTPVKSGKRATHKKEAHQAPFATFSSAELDTIKHEDKVQVDSSIKKLKERGSAEKVGGNGFDPQVYKDALAANVLTKRESSRRNFNGSGNILSHAADS